MTEIKAKNEDLEKLVKDMPLASLDMPLSEMNPTKKRAYKVRRLAEPHLREHRVKGKVYYTYCRGTDKEIYLGSAESILKVVTDKIRKPVRGRNKPRPAKSGLKRLSGS